MKRNMSIRVLMMEQGITQYDLAEILGVTPSWVSRLLRENLSEENENRIKTAIEEIERGRNNGKV